MIEGKRGSPSDPTYGFFYQHEINAMKRYKFWQMEAEAWLFKGTKDEEPIGNRAAYLSQLKEEIKA